MTADTAQTGTNPTTRQKALMPIRLAPWLVTAAVIAAVVAAAWLITH